MTIGINELQDLPGFLVRLDRASSSTLKINGLLKSCHRFCIALLRSVVDDFDISFLGAEPTRVDAASSDIEMGEFGYRLQDEFLPALYFGALSESAGGGFEGAVTKYRRSTVS